MLSAARTGEEYFALRMASQAAVKVFGNPVSRPHLPWSNGHTQVESAILHQMRGRTTIYSFAEARRLLISGSVLIMQNRTPEDCSLPGDTTHLRGYYFERYPRLLAREAARRPDSTTMLAALQHAGFRTIEERKLWETVKVYPDITALANELLARTGRSILHELSDEELRALVDYVHERFVGYDQQIVEQGRWTLWAASKD